MQEIKKYTELAKRTESPVDEIRLNPVFFLSVLDIAVAAGNMLDQMKKHAFYSKEYDEQRIREDFQIIVAGLEGVKSSFSELENETTFEVDPRVFHAILGISTESTELLEALDISGTTMDSVNILEECFDVDWYQFILMDALGGDLENIWDTGFAKLRKRFPNKFTTDDATDRDLDAEREILDTVNRSPDDTTENLS